MRRFGSNTKGSPKATWNHRDLFGNRLCILVSDTARCPQQCGSDASECNATLAVLGLDGLESTDHCASKSLRPERYHDPKYWRRRQGLISKIQVDATRPARSFRSWVLSSLAASTQA